jgi:WD40 repeat protein
VVKLFDVTTGKQRLPGPGPTWLGLDLAFSPDSRYLVSANAGPVQVWDFAAGRVASTWDTKAGGPLLFSGDGRMVTLMTWNHEVELWRFPEGKKLQSFRGPEKSIRAVALSRDGSRLAAGGEDKSVWLWRTDTGKMERVLPQQEQTEALIFSPDGRFLFSTTRDGNLKIWDLTPGAERQEPHSVEASASTLAFLPDGRTLAGVDDEYNIWLRNSTTGALERSLAGPQFGPKSERGVGNTSLVFGPGGQLAALGTPRGLLSVWQLGSNPLRQRDFRLLSPQGAYLRGLTISPDGRYLAATHPDGIICIYRLAERGRLPEMPVWKKPDAP